MAEMSPMEVAYLSRKINDAQKVIEVDVETPTTKTVYWFSNNLDSLDRLLKFMVNLNDDDRLY